MKKVLIVIVALVIVVAAGFLLRPINSSSSKPPTVAEAPATVTLQPNEQEATAAVRRYKVGFNTYTEAALKLGECSPAGAVPGVSCMAQVTLRPGSQPQNRTIGFAQASGQWEVSLW